MYREKAPADGRLVAEKPSGGTCYVFLSKHKGYRSSLMHLFPQKFRCPHQGAEFAYRYLVIFCCVGCQQAKHPGSPSTSICDALIIARLNVKPRERAQVAR